MTTHLVTPLSPRDTFRLSRGDMGVSHATDTTRHNTTYACMSFLGSWFYAMSSTHEPKNPDGST